MPFMQDCHQAMFPALPYTRLQRLGQGHCVTRSSPFSMFLPNCLFIIVSLSSRGRERERPIWQTRSISRLLRLCYRVPLPLSLKLTTWGFLFDRCTERSYCTYQSQKTKSHMVVYHFLHPYPKICCPFPHHRKKRVGGREKTQTR